MYRYPVRADAAAVIKGNSEAPCLSGNVRFYRECGHIRVEADLSGLPQNNSGFFALHIHEGGSCAGDTFPQTGGHYNPKDMPHPCHAGDLPPLLSCHGYAHLSVRTDRFTIEDILGKTVVIHSDPDDFRSQPAGNAGSKIACGVICGCRCGHA